MIRSITTALALLTLAPMSALAELTRYDIDSYYATDAKDRTHYIQYERMDHEGDVLVMVTVEGYVQYYWVDCATDRISMAGDNFDGWDYVDHRNMEGYYSDVACRR